MSSRRLTRRDLLRMAGGALAAPVAAACGGPIAERLAIEPSAPPFPLSSQPPPGAGPAPLLVMLHGAGGTGRRAANMIFALAEQRGCMVLAPDSRGTTWDAITGRFGPDVRFLERALRETLGRRAVDRSRVGMAGFSDGATYALILGGANGDLFTHLIAFSPGFLIPVRAAGAPRIFVSHGRQDPILPIDSCSRRLVPLLRGARYDVRYREFDGEHEVPTQVKQDALDWFMGVPA